MCWEIKPLYIPFCKSYWCKTTVSDHYSTKTPKKPKKQTNQKKHKTIKKLHCQYVY